MSRVKVTQRRNGRVKVTVKRRHGWKFNLARFLVILLVLVFLVKKYYAGPDIPHLPFIDCTGQQQAPGQVVPAVQTQQDGTQQVVSIPLGGIGRWLFTATVHTTLAVTSWTIGSAARDLEGGTPNAQTVNDTWRGIASGVGWMFATVLNAFDGSPKPHNPGYEHLPPPRLRINPHGIVSTLNTATGCQPCPTTHAQPTIYGGPGMIVVSAKAALAAGFSKAEAITAVAVAGAESGWRPAVRNSIGASGLWQILQSAHPQLFHGRTWTNPYVNARMARSVYVAAGHSWTPWTTWTSGTYRSHLGQARAAVTAVSSGNAGAMTPYLGKPAGCGSTSPVVFPLPAGTYDDKHNYGARGSMWTRNFHTGDDLGAPCGTPVRAATNGRVVVDRHQAWAGTWLIKVVRSPHGLATWYAHTQRLYVHTGQRVAAGQHIADVGDRGNAIGCHLHFEVHLHNGSIYGPDRRNPDPWLAHNVGRTLGGGAAIPTLATASTARHTHGQVFALATFNVLGSSHTGWGSASRRIRHAAALLVRHRVDVAGLQEFQRPQARAFDRLVGSAYSRWSSTRDPENSIVWRTDAFTFLSGHLQRIVYFDGSTRMMPVVHLLYRDGTPMWFMNVHNPAETRRFHHQGGYRRTDVGREVRSLHRIAATGEPVFLTGDMNDHGAFAGPMRAAGMTSATGWHYRGIDWIVAPRGTRFLSSTVDRSPLDRAASDHPIVVTRVRAGTVVAGGYRS